MLTGSVPDSRPWGQLQAPVTVTIVCTRKNAPKCRSAKRAYLGAPFQEGREGRKEIFLESWELREAGREWLPVKSDSGPLARQGRLGSSI